MKGLPCRKCNGTGVFSAKGLKAVAKIVREEVSEYLENEGSLRKMFDEYIGARKQKNDSENHEGFTCSACHTTPIRGIRYQCSVRPNYSLC
jgi:hypothetical protein